MEFECPKCHNKHRLGRLRASWCCPKCKATLVIQNEWKRTGKVVGEYAMQEYIRMW